MISDPVKTNATTFAGQMKEKWSALTDGDLEGIAGRKDPLVGKLQERYGYGKEQAEREADEFLRVHPEMIATPNSPTTEPEHARAPLPQVRPKEPAPEVASISVTMQPSSEAKEFAGAGYGHSVTVWISPRALRWSIPIATVALFFFLFLPWTGAFPSGYPAYTQNAFQTIYGGVSVDPVTTKALDYPQPYDQVDKNPLMLLYVVLVALALIMVVAPLVFSPSRIQGYHPFIQAVWRRREGILGATALATFAALMIQLWMGFGFETSVAAKADKNLAVELAAAKTPEERQEANIRRGLEVSPFNLSHTRWLHLAVFCNAGILVGVGLEYWLKRRGARPLPRIDAHA